MLERTTQLWLCKGFPFPLYDPSVSTFDFNIGHLGWYYWTLRYKQEHILPIGWVKNTYFNIMYNFSTTRYHTTQHDMTQQNMILPDPSCHATVNILHMHHADWYINLGFVFGTHATALQSIVKIVTQSTYRLSLTYFSLLCIFAYVQSGTPHSIHFLSHRVTNKFVKLIIYLLKIGYHPYISRTLRRHIKTLNSWKQDR